MTEAVGNAPEQSHSEIHKDKLILFQQSRESRVTCGCSLKSTHQRLLKPGLLLSRRFVLH